MAARAAMMPVKDSATRDPSIRLQRTASQLSRTNTLSLKDESLTSNAGGVMMPMDYSNNVPSHPSMSSPLAQSFEQSRQSRGMLQDDHTDLSGSAGYGEGSTTLQRSASAVSMSRSNTLKKQKSFGRKSSLKRSSSKRSVRAGSIGGITYDDTSGVNTRSVFYTPVPTSGSPTEVLANRFQGKSLFCLNPARRPMRNRSRSMEWKPLGVCQSKKRTVCSSVICW
jgi:hypothetical protein